MSIEFRKRKRGTSKQIGNLFPVKSDEYVSKNMRIERIERKMRPTSESRNYLRDLAPSGIDMNRRELNDEDIVSIRKQIAEIGQREFGSSHTGFVGLDLLRDDRVKVETKSLSERLLEAVEAEGDEFISGMLDEYETAYFYDPQSKVVEYLGDDGKVGWLEAKNFIEQNPNKYFVTFYADGILGIYPEVGKIPKKIKLVSLEEAWE